MAGIVGKLFLAILIVLNDGICKMIIMSSGVVFGYFFFEITPINGGFILCTQCISSLINAHNSHQLF